MFETSQFCRALRNFAEFLPHLTREMAPNCFELDHLAREFRQRESEQGEGASGLKSNADEMAVRGLLDHDWLWLQA